MKSVYGSTYFAGGGGGGSSGGLSGGSTSGSGGLGGGKYFCIYPQLPHTLFISFECNIILTKHPRYTPSFNVLTHSLKESSLLHPSTPFL